MPEAKKKKEDAAAAPASVAGDPLSSSSDQIEVPHLVKEGTDCFELSVSEEAIENRAPSSSSPLIALPTFHLKTKNSPPVPPQATRHELVQHLRLGDGLVREGPDRLHRLGLSRRAERAQPVPGRAHRRAGAGRARAAVGRGREAGEARVGGAAGGAVERELLVQALVCRTSLKK